MALPVSTVAPMPSPRLIDPGQYSPHVEVNIPGLDKPLRDLVCGCVFNNLAQKANVNRLRTFTYNLIAKGDHRSQDYIELCEYAGNYAVNSYLKDKKKLESTGSSDMPGNMTARIHEKVPEAITLWMSSLIPRFKDLEYEIGSSLAHKTKQLYKTYINSQTEIKNMSLDPNTAMALAQLLSSQTGGSANTGTNAILQALQQQNDPVIPVNINGQIVQMPRSQALALKAARESGQLGGGGNNILAALGLIQGNQASAGNGIGAVLSGLQQGTAGMLGGITSDTAVNSSAGLTSPNNKLLREWRKSRGEDIEEVEIIKEAPSFGHSVVVDLTTDQGSASTGLSLNKPEVVKEVSVTTVDVKGKNEMITTKRLKIDGGSEQEHAKEHITLFGFNVVKQTTPSYVKLGICVSRLASAQPESSLIIYENSANDSSETNDTEDEAVNEVNSELVNVIIDNSPIISDSNMSLVAKARELYIKQYLTFPESQEKLFLVHGYTVKPIYHTNNALESVANTLFPRMSNILGLRQHMENLVAANVEALKKEEDYYSADAVRSVIVFAEAFGSYITKMINEFLHYELNAGIDIDNFVLDYKDLEVVVARRFGENGTKALDAFSTRLMDSMREGNTKLIRDYLAVQADELNIKASAITETSIVVHVPFTEGELGLHCVNSPRYFDKENHNTLVNLVKAINLAEEKLEFTAMNKFLITADGSVLAVYPAPSQEGDRGLHIRKVSDR